MRDSPSLNIIPALIKNNCFLKVFDPEGMKEAKNYVLKSIQKNNNGVRILMKLLKILML